MKMVKITSLNDQGFNHYEVRLWISHGSCPDNIRSEFFMPCYVGCHGVCSARDWVRWMCCYP